MASIGKKDEGIAGEKKLIQLSIRQRLNIEGLIRQERPDDDDTVYLLRDLLKKVRIPEEERIQYVHLAMGQQIFDEKAILAAKGIIEAELNLPEARKLKTLVKKWRPNVDDLEWRDPLLEQLEAVK